VLPGAAGPDWARRLSGRKPISAVMGDDVLEVPIAAERHGNRWPRAIY